jgi:hypothetical protein
MVRCHACGLLHCAVLSNLSSHGLRGGLKPVASRAHSAANMVDRLLMGSSLTTEGLMSTHGIRYLHPLVLILCRGAADRVVVE